MNIYFINQSMINIITFFFYMYMSIIFVKKFLIIFLKYNFNLNMNNELSKDKVFNNVNTQNIEKNSEGIFYDKPYYDKEKSMLNLIPVENNGNKIIYKGTYSIVYLYKDIKTEELISVKYIEKQLYLKFLNTTQIIYNEIEIHSRLVHPNIIRLYNIYENASSIYLLMEFAKNGNLYSLIRRRNGMNEKNAYKYFSQIVNAVYFLHKNNIIHRDIKPENIVLDENENCKLCDFGWSIILNDNSKRNTFCGTLEYMAPEIINNEGYEKSIDIWSLGILLYEMIHGYCPFNSNNNNKNNSILNKIINENFKIKKDISNECKDLIYKMLEKDYKKRINIEQILNHQFMIKNKKNIQKYIIQINEKEKLFNTNIEMKKIKKFSSNFLNKNDNNYLSASKGYFNNIFKNKIKYFTQNLLDENISDKKLNSNFSSSNIGFKNGKKNVIKLTFTMTSPNNKKNFLSSKNIKSNELFNLNNKKNEMFEKENEEIVTESRIQNPQNDTKLDFSLFENIIEILK